VIELAVISALLIALAAWQQVDRRQERREVAAERRDLLLRIQAPEVIVTRALNDEAEPGPQAIDMSDGPNADDSYWQAREETVDELAERLMAEETQVRG
jgi:hypothetical protein